jgi:hypothetical protein
MVEVDISVERLPPGPQDPGPGRKADPELEDPDPGQPSNHEMAALVDQDEAAERHLTEVEHLRRDGADSDGGSFRGRLETGERSHARNSS